jgi:hypothetical protein
MVESEGKRTVGQDRMAARPSSSNHVLLGPCRASIDQDLSIQQCQVYVLVLKSGVLLYLPCDTAKGTRVCVYEVLVGKPQALGCPWLSWDEWLHWVGDEWILVCSSSVAGPCMTTSVKELRLLMSLVSFGRSDCTGLTDCCGRRLGWCRTS